MRRLTLIALAAGVSACSMHHAAKFPASIPKLAGTQRDVFALKYIDAVVGKGAVAEPRKCLYVHYTGWLLDGTKFDSSVGFESDGGPKAPIAFPQGMGRVIPGWDMGFEGMRVGGKRRLFIPYQLAYGESGSPPIPAKANLIFDVELMAVGEGPQCPPWAAVKKTE